MKRNLTALFLVLLYGIALIKPAMPLIDYYTKLDAYLEQCINKDRPDLQCKGQCILMQKIKALNGEADTPVPPSPVKINLQDYPVAIIEVDHLGLANILSDQNQVAFKVPVFPVGYRTDIFRPPC